MRLFQKRFFHLSLVLTLTLPAFSVSAVPFAVDGDLKDWINQPQGQATDWQPYKTNVFYSIEDQYKDFLNPGYGGQDYDAEAMYVAIDSGNLYITVVSGVDSSVIDWPPGDIAIDFGNDDTFEYGVVTYSDEDNSKGGIGSAGDFYEVSEWNYGIWEDDPNTGYSKNAHPTNIKSGEKKGEVPYSLNKAKWDGSQISKLGAYPTNSDDSHQHYVFETAIPLNLFDPNLLGQKFTVHWTMACANDWFEGVPFPVPEPPVTLLMGIGLAGMAMRKGLKRRQPDK